MPEYIRKAKVTLIILAVNIALFLIESFTGGSENTENAIRFGAYFYPLIAENHEWYRFITAMFLHFGSAHLISNMISLIAIGPYVELTAGKVTFIVIYLVSGFCGNLLTYFYEMMTGFYHVSAGASGCICGLLGTYLVIYISSARQTPGRGIKNILLAVACALLPGIEDPSINLAAHIGGLIGGFILGGIFLFIHRKISLRKTTI